MGRIADQFGGLYRRCDCQRRKVPEKRCPHPWYYRVRHGAQEIRRMVGPGKAGKAIARQKLDEIRGRLMREEHLGVRTVAHATLAEFRKRIAGEARPRMTPDSWRAFSFRLGVAEAFFTEAMDAITPGRVREFLRHLGTRREGRTVKAATRNRYLDTLSVALSFAVGEGYAARNPVEGVKREREAREAPPRVSRADLGAIASRCPAPVGDLVRLVFDTGLRRAEAMALERRDIDLEAAVLVVRRAKSKRFRTVPLNAPARALVGRLLREGAPAMSGGTPLFRDLPPADMVSRIVSDAAKAASLPGVTLHKIRAAFVTAALEAGVGSSVVRDLAGHSSVAVTDRYAAGAPTDAMREAVRRIEGAPDRAPAGRTRRVS